MRATTCHSSPARSPTKPNVDDAQCIVLTHKAGEIHDPSQGFSILNNMHEMYCHSGDRGNDIQAEGLKQSVISWSGAYYVAYALMMTIAFAMLVECPEPRDQSTDASRSPTFRVIHYRPVSEGLDAIIQLMYVFFAASSCYDSTWGMMLCAEWGVRAPVVPPALYERFMALLDPHGAKNASLSAWFCRCFETRAVHKPMKSYGLFFDDGGQRTGVGVSEAPAWDPFYLVDRTAQSLFLTGGCSSLFTAQSLHRTVPSPHSPFTAQSLFLRGGCSLPYISPDLPPYLTTSRRISSFQVCAWSTSPKACRTRRSPSSSSSPCGSVSRSTGSSSRRRCGQVQLLLPRTSTLPPHSPTHIAKATSIRLHPSTAFAHIRPRPLITWTALKEHQHAAKAPRAPAHRPSAHRPTVDTSPTAPAGAPPKKRAPSGVIDPLAHCEEGQHAVDGHHVVDPIVRGAVATAGGLGTTTAGGHGATTGGFGAAATGGASSSLWGSPPAVSSPMGSPPSAANQVEPMDARATDDTAPLLPNDGALASFDLALATSAPPPVLVSSARSGRGGGRTAPPPKRVTTTSHSARGASERRGPTPPPAMTVTHAAHRPVSHMASQLPPGYRTVEARPGGRR